jgi:hypothetical protein
MKKVKMIISAAIVFTVVGSALAFKIKTIPDLLTCPQGICILQTSTTYSSIANGPEITPHPPLYKGTVGKPCDTQECPRYNGKVYNNQ